MPSDKVAEKCCDRWDNQEKKPEILTKLVRKRLTKVLFQLQRNSRASWGQTFRFVFFVREHPKRDEHN